MPTCGVLGCKGWTFREGGKCYYHTVLVDVDDIDLELGIDDKEEE